MRKGEMRKDEKTHEDQNNQKTNRINQKPNTNLE